MEKIYRQGDILFTKVESMPENTSKIDSKIIEKGEVSGHAHVIENGNLYSTWRTPMYIQAKENAVVVHEEHDPIDLPKGTYRIVRQRQYSGPVSD